MNFVEVQKEIDRISPAAGRESAKLLQEIARLNTLNAQHNTEMVRRQEELQRGTEAANAVINELRQTLNSQADVMAQQNTELIDLRGFARQVRYELQSAGMQHDEGVELLGQLRGWLEAEPDRTFDVVAEKLTQVSVVINGLPPKAVTNARLRGQTVHQLTEMFLLDVAKYRAGREEAEAAQAGLTREVQDMRGLVLMKLQEFTDLPASEITIPPTFTDFKAAFNAVLSSIRVRQDALREGSKQNLDRRVYKTIEMCAQDLAAALGGKGDEGRPGSANEWLANLLDRVHNLRDRNAAGEEALNNALNHNRELEQALTELKPHSYDIEGVQAEAQGLAEAFDRTHTALLQMQDGYIGEHNKRLKLRRDLRQAQADIELLKTSSGLAVGRLQAVDMALRGESADIETVSPYRSPTLDLAERIWTRLGDYRRVAEREVSWRQQVERERDDFAKQLRAYQKDGYLKRVAQTESSAPETEQDQTWVDPTDYSGGVAECGQPFPCEHAPDGGNHPKVNILGQWRHPVDPPKKEAW